MANNADNLIPNSERTPIEIKEMTSNGGKRSGEVRREKKLFQQAVLAALQAKGESGDCVLVDLIAAQVKKAMKGDTRAFEVLRSDNRIAYVFRRT